MESTNNKRQIAVFADVHGLYEPLEVILKDIKKRGITEIYSLGDNIGLGPNPKEVLDLLDEYNVVSIAGNNEEYINLGTAPFDYFGYSKEEELAFTKSQLTKEQIEKLKTFPKFIEITVGGKKLALCHFANDIRCDYSVHSTWSYQDYPQSSYNQFYYTNSKKHLERIALEVGYPIYSRFSEFDSNDSITKLNLLRDYIKTNDIKTPHLMGFVSYVNNPLFLTDNILKTVNDYDAIIQGHVHFESNVLTDKTNFHTLRAVGMGNKNGRDDLAAYSIITESDNGYKLEKVEVPFNKNNMDKTIIKTRFPKRVISRFTNVKPL